LLSLSRAAIELLASPSALLKMMRARSLNERGSERLRAYDVSQPPANPGVWRFAPRQGFAAPGVARP